MIIYKSTNLVNDDFYIGLSTDVTLCSPVGRHKYRSLTANIEGHFYNAIRKYGWDNFKFEIIDSDATSVDHLKELEIWYIEHLKPKYNMTKGGDGSLGRIMSQESKIKLSKTQTGNKYCLGYRHTDEAKSKMSTSQRNRARTQKEIDNWRFASKGKKRSEESRKRISDGLKGRIFSEEHRRNISIAIRRKKVNEKFVCLDF